MSEIGEEDMLVGSIHSTVDVEDPHIRKGLIKKQLNALRSTLNDEILSNPDTFIKFIKNYSSLEVVLNNDIPLKFHFNSLENIFFYQPQVRCIRTFDLDYNVVTLLRRVDIEGMRVIENIPKEFHQDLNYPQAFIIPPVRFHHILAWNSESIYVVKPHGFKRFHHSIGKIVDAIGYFKNDSGRTLFVTFLVKIDQQYKFISSEIGKSFNVLRRMAINSTPNTYISQQLTHFMIIDGSRVTFINTNLQENSFDLNFPIEKCPGSEAIFFRTKKAILYELETKCQLIYLESKISKSFSKVTLIPFNSFQEEFYFIDRNNRLKTSTTIEGLDNISLMCRTYDNGVQVTHTNIFMPYHKKVIIKESNVNRIFIDQSPEDWDETLDPSEWKCRSFQRAFTPQQIDHFKTFKKEREDFGFEVRLLQDCIVISKNNNLIFYDVDKGREIMNFGDMIYRQVKSERPRLRSSIQVLEGSFKFRRFFLKADDELIALTAFPKQHPTYQFRIDTKTSLVIPNRDSTVFTTNNKVFKLMGGEFVRIKGQFENNVFASILRNYLVSFRDNGSYVLDPVQIFSFETLLPLWKLKIFDRPDFPIPLVKTFLFDSEAEFIYFYTSEQKYKVDNRKRFNNRELLGVQNVLYCREEEIRKNISENKDLWLDSCIFESFLHPIVVSFYNVTRHGYKVWDHFEYPRHIIANSPLIVASKFPAETAIENMIDFLLEKMEIFGYLQLTKEEFLMLLNNDYPNSHRLIAAYIRQLIRIEGGYSYGLDSYYNLPNPAMMISSDNFNFQPEVLNELTQDNRDYLPYSHIHVTKVWMPKNYDTNGEKKANVSVKDLDFVSVEPFNIVGNNFKGDEPMPNIHKQMIFEKTNTNPASKMQGQQDGKQVMFYRLQINADFNIGTRMSEDFLKAYKESESAIFVLSPFRAILDVKWGQLRFISLFQAFLFMITVILYIALCFQMQNYPLFVIVFILLAFFFLLELTVGLLDYREYLSDYENFLDMLGILSAMAACIWNVTLTNYELTEPLQIMMIISLIFLTFRFFAAMKVIPQLTHVMIMIFEIFWGIKWLTIIFGFVIVAYGFLYAKTFRIAAFGTWINHSFNSVFGNLLDDIEPSTWVQWLVLLTEGIFLDIILTNIMIARMTNDYEELDNRNHMLIYQYKAKLVLECEMRIRLWLSILSFLGFAKEELDGDGFVKYVKMKDINYHFIVTTSIKNYATETEEFKQEEMARTLKKFKNFSRGYRREAQLMKYKIHKNIEILKDKAKVLAEGWQNLNEMVPMVDHPSKNDESQVNISHYSVDQLEM